MIFLGQVRVVQLGMVLVICDYLCDKLDDRPMHCVTVANLPVG